MGREFGDDVWTRHRCTRAIREGGEGGELCEVSGGVDRQVGKKNEETEEAREKIVGQSSVKLGTWIPGYLDSRLKRCAIG